MILFADGGPHQMVVGVSRLFCVLVVAVGGIAAALALGHRGDAAALCSIVLLLESL